MDIIVLMKQVPDTEAPVEIAESKDCLDTEDLKWAINPYDEFAVEEALRIREAQGGSVTIVSAGKEKATEAIRTALAMGADAIALGTAMMMALGCQQYRLCDTGKCPVGIATQDPKLRARLHVEQSAARVANFFRVSTEEIKDFARLTGNDNVHFSQGINIRGIFERF